MLYKELVKEWLQEKQNYVKESTYALYDYEMKNYILPALGNYDVIDVTEGVIQECAIRWQNTKSSSGNFLKVSTIQNWIVLIKQTIRYAVRKNYLDQYNIKIFIPTTFTPNLVRDNRTVFTTDEQKRIMQYVDAHPNQNTIGIALCLSSGLRIGEVCALQWQDINLHNQTVYVGKTIQRIYNKETTPHTHIIITPPKSISSVRTIPLSHHTWMLLKTLKEELCPTETEYLLSGTDFPLEPRCYRRFYGKFLEMANVSYRKFHCLRHTFATYCVEKGGDYKCISEMLGHSSIKITMDRYVHPNIEQKRKLVEMLEL